MIANANRDPKKKSQPFEASDFFDSLRVKRKRSAKEVIAAVKERFQED